MSKLFVVLPSYNESACILKVFEDWDNQFKSLSTFGKISLELIVVDDGSKDHTCDLVRGYQQNHPSVVLLQHEINQGLGAAILTGIQYVLEVCSEEDRMCIMDSDHTHSAKYIFAMMDQMKLSGADVVTASRYQAGAEVHGLSKFREALSYCASWYYMASMKIPNVKDYTCGYRLYSVGILQKLYATYSQHIITQSGFTCMAELMYKIYCVGGVFAEIPFVLRYDLKESESKMKVIRTCLSSLLLPIKLRLRSSQKSVYQQAEVETIQSHEVV